MLKIDCEKTSLQEILYFWNTYPKELAYLYRSDQVNSFNSAAFLTDETKSRAGGP